MARIIVTTEAAGHGAGPVFLEESVHPVHLSTEHAARQLVERLNWALSDAEAAERVRLERAHLERRAPRPSSPATATSRRRPSRSRAT